MLALRSMLSLTGMERPMRPLAKSCDGDIPNSAPHACVGPHAFQVRAEARPSRTDEACAMDVVKAHRAKAVARSEPGVENVTRTQRQPANRAKTEAEAYSEAPATKAEERDVSGRPHGRPPKPRPATSANAPPYMNQRP